ncbi:MAG: thiamine phosphate synthase [Thermodesulfobacteriota bacterium]
MAITFDIYLITDRDQTGGRPLKRIVEDSIKGGIRAVQLREKGLDARDLFSIAKELKSITRVAGAKFFINDRLDIAIAADADGIHLGQKSISPSDVRGTIGEKMLIGVSAHSLDEALNAQQAGADFVTLGPAYDTPSKRKYGPPVGIAVLREVSQRLNIPVFAIGGIKVERVGEVIMAGAYGIALISAIMADNDPEMAARAMVEEVRFWKKKRAGREI